jgi:DNA mismatch repair protein MutS
MQQYRDIKARHPGTILFFRMGDFYETFYDDAELTARVLGLTLTARNNGGASDVPLAGVPVKAGSEYVRRLVQQGYRVSICEQVEDPKLAKGVVKREVIETVTPGAAFADELLDGGRNNFLCSLVEQNGTAGIAAMDISTGEFRLVTVDAANLDAAIARLSPREIIVPDGAADESLARRRITDVLHTPRAAWEFDAGLAHEELQRQFGVLSLDGFGVEARYALAIAAAGALFRYVRELQPAGVPHVRRPQVERPGGVMPLDEMTRRNLELVESLRGGQEPRAEGTLLSVLDRTLTPMGARLLRQWILAPRTDRANRARWRSRCGAARR